MMHMIRENTFPVTKWALMVACVLPTFVDRMWKVGFMNAISETSFVLTFLRTGMSISTFMFIKFIFSYMIGFQRAWKLTFIYWTFFGASMIPLTAMMFTFMPKYINTLELVFLATQSLFTRKLTKMSGLAITISLMILTHHTQSSAYSAIFIT